MVFFAFVIVCVLNILGLLYLVPPDLWIDNGYRLPDYVQTSPELQLDFLGDLGGQPDVLEIVPEESSFVVAPSTGPDLFAVVPEENALVVWAPSIGPDLFAVVPEENALVVWAPSTTPNFLEIVSKENALVMTPSIALSLLHRSEDDHSQTLILLMMFSVPVALLLYKVYLLVRRAFAKRPCEDSPGSAHDDDPDNVADEDSGISSLKQPPSDNGTDMQDTEKNDGEVSSRSPMMTVLPQSIQDPINDEEEGGVIETIEASPVFVPSEMECTSHDNHEDANHDVNVAINTSPVFEPEIECTSHDNHEDANHDVNVAIDTSPVFEPEMEYTSHDNHEDANHDVNVAIDTSPVFEPEMECISTPAPSLMIRLEAESSLKETVQDAESFIQFMGNKIPVDDHPEQGTSATLDIPRECHAFIFGKNGRVLSEIIYKAKVIIIMPSSDNAVSRDVVIEGNPRNIQKAAKHIEKILKKCHRTKD